MCSCWHFQPPLLHLSSPCLFSAWETTAAPFLLLKWAVRRGRGNFCQPVAAGGWHGIHLPSEGPQLAQTPNQSPCHLCPSWLGWELCPMNGLWEQPGNRGQAMLNPVPFCAGAMHSFQPEQGKRSPRRSAPRAQWSGSHGPSWPESGLEASFPWRSSFFVFLCLVPGGAASYFSQG